jgi:apolipoprotein N-acyltransferase
VIGLGSRRARWLLGAATASGLLLFCASPAIGAGELAWVALAPAAAAALRWPDTRAGRLAVPLAYGLYLELLLVPALPFGIAGGQWGDPPPVMIGDSPVVFVALIAIPLFAAGLYAIRFGEPWVADRLPPTLRPLGLVAIPAAAFTALDFVRVQLDPGGLWGPLFLSQQGRDPAAVAALGGPWLLTFAIAASGYAIALAAVEGVPALRAGRRRAARAAAATAAALIAFGVLAAVAPGAPDGDRENRLTVGVVQPGYDTAEEDRPELRYFRPGTRDLATLDLIRDLAPLTRRAAGEGAEVVVWPEALMWVDPGADPRADAALRRLARETGSAIVATYFDPVDDQGAAFAVLPDGSFTPDRPKQRPMWFLGEDGGNRRPPAPVLAGPARIGTMLGVDNQDPDLARRLAEGGADLIASATHDWEQLATQQRAFSSIHARATETPVARSDWRYGSALFDSHGELVAAAAEGKRREVLVAPLDLRSGETPYLTLGDAIGWASLGLSLIAVVSAAVLRRRDRGRLAAALP